MATHAEKVERIIEYREGRRNKIVRNSEAIGLETDLLTKEEKMKKEENSGFSSRIQEQTMLGPITTKNSQYKERSNLKEHRG